MSDNLSGVTKKNVSPELLFNESPKDRTVEFFTEKYAENKPDWLKEKYHPLIPGAVFVSDDQDIDDDDSFVLEKQKIRKELLHELESDLTTKFRRTFARNHDDDLVELYVRPNIFVESAIITNDREKYNLLIGVKKSVVLSTLQSSITRTFSRFDSYLMNSQNCLDDIVLCLHDVSNMLDDGDTSLRNKITLLEELVKNSGEANNLLLNKLETYLENAKELSMKFKDGRRYTKQFKSALPITLVIPVSETRQLYKMFKEDITELLTKNGYDNIIIAESHSPSHTYRADRVYFSIDHVSSKALSSAWIFEYAATISYGSESLVLNDYFSSVRAIDSAAENAVEASYEFFEDNIHKLLSTFTPL